MKGTLEPDERREGRRTALIGSVVGHILKGWRRDPAAGGGPLRLHRERLKRLADNIRTLSAKDDLLLQKAREMAIVRQKAALQLFGVCAGFVRDLNALLEGPDVRLDPEHFAPEAFQDDGMNLFQIHVRGRILQVTFESTAELISTEEFRVPYVLHGATRCFNQQLLDQELIEEHLLFYCLERNHSMWRFFDTRTYHTGVFDEEYLISLLERLV